MPSLSTFWSSRVLHDDYLKMMKESNCQSRRLLTKTSSSHSSKLLAFVTSYDLAFQLFDPTWDDSEPSTSPDPRFEQTGSNLSSSCLSQLSRKVAYQPMLRTILPEQLSPHQPVDENLLILQEAYRGASDQSFYRLNRRSWNDSRDIQSYTQDDIRGRAVMIIDHWIENILLADPKTQSTEIDEKRQSWRGQDLFEDLGESKTLKLKAASNRLAYELNLGSHLGVTSHGAINPWTTEQERDENLEDWDEVCSRGHEIFSDMERACDESDPNRTSYQDPCNQEKQRLWCAYTKRTVYVENVLDNCPFNVDVGGKATLPSTCTNLSFFTSSFASECLASLILAVLMQLFRTKKDQDGSNVSLADSLARQTDLALRQAMVRSIVLETERLCPPVVCTLRTVTAPQGFRVDGVHLESGTTLLTYLPEVNRDPLVFGNESREFNPSRYLDVEGIVKPALTFGSGVKDCWGRETVHLWLETLILSIVGHRPQRPIMIWDTHEPMEGDDPIPLLPPPPETKGFNIELHEESLPLPVRDWLGWVQQDQESTEIYTWKDHMLQIPTQIPIKEICARLLPRA